MMTLVCRYLNELLPTRSRLYSVEDIVQILLHPALQSSNICCRRVPTSISESVSFVIDLNSLDNKDDILSDDLGVVVYPS